jgi:hypothetical protein
MKWKKYLYVSISMFHKLSYFQLTKNEVQRFAYSCYVIRNSKEFNFCHSLQLLYFMIPTTSEKFSENAILIIGPRKSGTTLTQSMLDGANEIIVRPNELKIKYFIKEYCQNSEESKINFFKNKRKIHDFENLNHEIYLKGITKLNSQNLTDLIKDEIALIYDSLHHKPVDIKAWAAKEAGGNITGIVTLWKQLFFNGKIIFVVRNPLMIVRSIIIDGRKKQQRMGFNRILKEVRTASRSLQRIKKHTHKPYCFTVVYEELTENPNTVMKDLCEFLEIGFSEILTQPTVFGISSIVSTSSRDVKYVFKGEKKWYYDLTFREKLLILVFSTLYIRFNYSSYKQKITKYSKMSD